MNNRDIIGRMFVLFVGMLFLLLSTGLVFSSYANDIVIIGNKDVPVDYLSRDEVRSIFLGEKVMWSNDRSITFVILKTRAHDVFLAEYIGNTASQYRNYWRKMVFTGKSRSPRSFKTEEELLDYIANTSGAVGYIPFDAYTDKVKIIMGKKEKDG